MTLNEIGLKYGTDKASNFHDYLNWYESKLPKKCRTFLEIGVESGKSALMWDEYYGHDEIELHLIDLFINPDFVSKRWCINRGFQAHKGDQSDIDFLYTIKEFFQVILDDGSHRADHMIISFKHLFVNNCVSGSLYFIEDLACNKDQFYWGGEVTAFEHTPLAMFKKFLATGKIVNPYFNEVDSSDFERMIDSVEIFDDKVVMIKRK